MGNLCASSRLGMHTFSLAVALILAFPGSRYTDTPAGTLRTGERTQPPGVVTTVQLMEAGQAESGAGGSAATVTADVGAWPMAGANPQRTSWTPEEVRGMMYPLWAVSIEPFIPFGNQIIAAHDTLYVSTAGGLIALNAETGALRWSFPTEIPLGNAPTVDGDVVYVGGHDHHLYALDALSGRELWTYEAGGGFSTNPLVVEGKIILGNRDGWLYAITTDGILDWRFQTGGPILFSAAYKDGVVYFASDDAHAYALSVDNGSLQWKSSKLPGDGFDAYWPVIYTRNGTDYVVLGGSNDYRLGGELSVGMLNNTLDRNALYYDIPEGQLVGPTGTEPGDWVPGTITIDDSRAAQYLEANPTRRRVFILRADNGQEYTFDLDGDGRPEYAPITWYGTHGGSRYPAIIGSDSVLYMGNSYVSKPYIPQGGPSGWKFGTQFISRVHTGNYGAVDEPLAVSAGGNLIYWGWFSGRDGMGAYDITLPYGTANRGWVYWAAGSPDYIVNACPGAGSMFGQAVSGYPFEYYTAGTDLGIYRRHGNQNPPVPYKGRIYFHALNTVFALSATRASCQSTSLSVGGAEPAALAITKDGIAQELTSEIERIVAAGHLRPGYYHGTNATYQLGSLANSYMTDYYHNPGETFVTLIDALPYLPATLQQQVRAYLQAEWVAYGDKVHIGWRDGAARESYDIPPEIQTRMDGFGPQTTIYGSTWDYRYSLYGRWRYVKEFGDTVLAGQVFGQIRNTTPIGPPEQDSDVGGIYNPYIKNAYIAGYIGYVGIGKMAGIPEAELAPYSAELDRLLAERAAEFSTDQPAPVADANTVTIARNFMYMTPDLAAYLRVHSLAKVQAALNEYYRVAPYWFVSKYNATSNEGVLQPLYDYASLFQAKAYIVQEPFRELVKWLDTPAFDRGDLFYIQNLIAALKADTASGLEMTGVPSAASQSENLTFALGFYGYTGTLTVTNTLPLGLSAPEFLASEGTTVSPTYESGSRQITWRFTDLAAAEVLLRYRVTVTTDQPSALSNSAELIEPDGDSRTASFTVIVNPRRAFLPLIMRNW